MLARILAWGWRVLADVFELAAAGTPSPSPRQRFEHRTQPAHGVAAVAHPEALRVEHEEFDGHRVSELVYTANPTRNARLNPKKSAVMRVLKIPSTEKQTFVAHAHGIRSAELRARMRMPIGKSMPIEKASRKMAATAIAIWLFFFTDAPQNVPFEYEIH